MTPSTTSLPDDTSSVEASPLLDAARQYVERWAVPVFPCRPSGKAPLGELVPHGFLDASTDPEVIRGWWARHPDGNVAVSNGHGADALDVDGPEGEAALAKLLADLGITDDEAAGWAWDRSGRPDGGRRAWFRTPDCCPRRTLGPGLSWLGHGGYTVTPPSIHPSGNAYAWQAGGPPDELPEVPAALVAAIRPAPPPEGAHVGASGGEVDRTLPGGDYIARTTWAEVLEPHGWAQVGQRGAVTYWRRPGKSEGVSATAGYVGADALYLFSSNAPPLEAGRSYTRFGAYAVLEHGGDFSAAAGELRRQGYGQRPNRFRAGALSFAQVLDRPTPVWLVDGLVVVHTVAVLFGRWGTGKSFVALDWRLSAATGRDWLGRAVRPGPGLYIAGEGADGLGPRLRAWAQDHDGARPADGAFEVWPHPVDLLDDDQVAELVEYVAERRHELVVLDTLNCSLGGRSENDPGVMAAAFEAVDAVRRAHDRATPLVVHHPREDGGFRGAKNWPGNAQTVIAARGSAGSLTLSTHDDDQGKQKDGRPVRLQLQLREVAILGPDGAPLLGPDGTPLTSCLVEPQTVAGILIDFGGTPANRDAWLGLLRRRREVGLAVTGDEAAAFCRERRIAARTFRELVAALVDGGVMRKDGRGKTAVYTLPEK